MAILASIEVDDDGTLKIKNFRDALSDLENQSGKTSNGLGGLGEKSQKADNALDNLKSNAAATAIVFGALAGGVSLLLLESGKLAARVEVLNTVIGIAGKNANITSYELMQQVGAVKALGITTSVAQQSVISFVQANLKASDASKLARVAQDLAVIGNMNSSQAFDALTQSIQNQQVIMLKQFGIVTGLEQIYSEYGDTIGKNWRQLDANEKKQAFFNKIMSEGQKVAGAYEAAMNDVGKQMTSLDRLIENAKEKFGQALTPAMSIAVKMAFSLLEGFESLDHGTMALITTLAVFVATMATVSAAMAASKFLVAAGVFTAMLNPVTLVIAAVAALAAGIVYLTQKQNILTEEAIQAAAIAEDQRNKFQSLLKTYDELGPKIGKTKEEQSKYNDSVKALGKMAPEAVAGIDAMTGALNLNGVALGDNLRALQAVLDAELQRAKSEFAKRDIELAEARKKANAAAQEQLIIGEKLKSQGIDLNTINIEEELGVRQLTKAVRNHGDAVTTDRELYASAVSVARAHALTLKEVESAFKKESRLMDELDPKRREEIRLQREATEVARKKAEVERQAAEDSKEAIKKRTEAYKKASEQITGINQDERIQLEALNAALKKAGEGTDEYFRLVVKNKGAIQDSVNAHASMVKGLDALVIAQKRIKDAELAVELEEWAKKAEESRVAFKSLAGDISKAFGEDAIKILEDSSKKFVDVERSTAEQIRKVNEDLYERSVIAKMSETDRKIYENKKFYNNLILINNKQIEDIQRVVKEQETALTKAAEARKRDVDDIIAKVQLKFKIEIELEDKLDKFRKALAKPGGLGEAKQIQADFIKSINEMGAAEKTRIDEALSGSLRELQGKSGNLAAQVAAIKDQNDVIRSISNETTRKIIEESSTIRQVVINAWKAISSTVSDSITGILSGNMTLKEGLTSIWTGIKNMFFGIVQAMLKKWIDSMLKMDESAGQVGSSGVGPGGSKMGAGLGIGFAGFGVGGMIGGLTSNRTKGALGGAAGGAATGALMGSTIMPGIGTVAGAIIGGIGGAIGGFLSSNKKKKELEQEIKDVRAEIIKTFGDIAELGKIAAAAGVNMRILMDTKNPKEMQTEVAKLNKYIADQKKLWEGLNQAVEGLNKRAKGFSIDLQKSIDEQSKAIQVRYDLELSKMKESGVSSDDINKLKEKQVDELSKHIFTATEGQQKAFDRLGIYAVGIFAKIVKETGSVIQALATIGPTLDALIAAQSKFGMTGSESIQKLLGMREVVKANEDVFTSLEGITQILIGMRDAGMLTQGMFQALAVDTAAQYQTLIDRGVDANTAMALMQPTLQALWEAQKKFGTVTDESTAALLRQAVEQGIVGDHMKDVNERILTVLLAIADVFGATIPDSLRRAGDAAIEFGRVATRSFEEAGAAADAISFGQSPGGLKEIPLMLAKAREEGLVFSSSFITSMGKVSKEVDSMGSVGFESSNRPSSGTSSQQGASQNGPLVIQLISDGKKTAEVVVPYLPGLIQKYIG